MKPQEKPKTIEEVMRKWPRVTAHVICESLGYATPSKAALIILDAINDRENWCEWIYSCYGCDPRKAVRYAIQTRHYHKGYMADFHQAYALVRRYLASGDEPIFASWF